MAAPTESIRPRPDPRPARKQAALDMADQEFRVSLDPVLMEDPIARLGYKGNTGMMMNPNAEGAYYVPSDYEDERKLLGMEKLWEVQKAEPDSVFYSREYASSPTRRTAAPVSISRRTP